MWIHNNSSSSFSSNTLTAMKINKLQFILFLIISVLSDGLLASAPQIDPATDDKPLTEPLSLPEWFKASFLDVKEDLTEANNNKRGLIIYFGQEYCPYCKALLNNNWGRKDIIKYTRDNFDVIAINVRGHSLVSDIDAKQYSEKVFAAKHNATFTPTLLFFDKSGKPALKLVGYRQPYQFRAALEYVADNHHQQENFRYYLARAEGAESFGQEALNESVIFLPPPYQLDKLIRKKPLAVFFEEKKCHACDVLHAIPLNRRTILKQFSLLNSVQLDMWSDTPVKMPDGKETTAKKWADALELNHAPTIIFFDESGEEIIRVESVIGFYRLNGVLNYINTRAYRKQPSYELWRTESGKKSGKP